MTTRISYREIPKEERKRLAKEAYRKPAFLMIKFAAILAAMICGDYVANKMVAERYSLQNFFIAAIVAICVAVVIKLMLFDPLIRREVEKTKNA
jgi:hypothetical protein